MDLFGTLLAAFLTLAIFSFLYKENPLFRFAEHLLVGVSAGYYVVQFAFSALYKKLWVPVVDNGELLVAFGGVLGGLMLLRFFRGVEWVSRFSLAFYVGAGAGYTIPNILNAQVLAQVDSSLLSPMASTEPWTLVKEIIVLVGVGCVLGYFYFSREHKGALGAVSRVGITFLMIGFGASFGYTVMGRITLLIGRFQFLFEDVPKAFGGG